MYELVKRRLDYEKYINALKNMFYVAMYYVEKEDLTITDKVSLIKQITDFKAFNTIMNKQEKLRFYYISLRSMVGIRKRLNGLKKVFEKNV